MSDFKAIGGTVRARAANELRDRILTGRLAPGTRLDLDEITEEFGTSRTPVREALLELSYEGLVAVTPRSGITVLGITPEDAVDNFAVLAALAGKAAEWATARITEAQLDELDRLAAAVAEADDTVAANWRFHRAVNLAAGSARLLTYVRQAVRVVPMSYFEVFPEQERRSRAEHAALLDAIRRGDGMAARSIAEAHVLDAGEALGDWLRARDAERAARRTEPEGAGDDQRGRSVPMP
jgi:DNA-binding GntR family transcriptional regulator